VNWTDLLSFIPLAILCNTSLPLVFDPVLIYFASRQPGSSAWTLALIGSGCAAVAAAADIKLLRWVHIKSSERWMRWLPFWPGRWFYVLTFMCALLPVPFTIARLAAVRQPPDTVPYGLAVFCGRLPRYLLTVALWPALGLASNGAKFLLLVCVLVAVVKLTRRQFRFDANI
jgi:hypothetical protein